MEFNIFFFNSALIIGVLTKVFLCKEWCIESASMVAQCAEENCLFSIEDRTGQLCLEKDCQIFPSYDLKMVRSTTSSFQFITSTTNQRCCKSAEHEMDWVRGEAQSEKGKGEKITCVSDSLRFQAFTPPSSCMSTGDINEDICLGESLY